jgi:hypothetical protein
MSKQCLGHDFREYVSKWEGDDGIIEDTAGFSAYISNRRNGISAE